MFLLVPPFPWMIVMNDPCDVTTLSAEIVNSAGWNAMTGFIAVNLCLCPERKRSTLFNVKRSAKSL